ncbi:MAG: hypothetical protein ACR2JY_09450 [Chloroflexota bacterium]
MRLFLRGVRLKLRGKTRTGLMNTWVEDKTPKQRFEPRRAGKFEALPIFPQLQTAQQLNMEHFRQSLTFPPRIASDTARL